MKKFAPKVAGFGLLKLLSSRSSAWLAGCIAVPCLLLTTPAFSASFDCSKVGSSNEKIICSDPQLSAMDDKLGKTFKLARKKAADRRAFNAASDKQWRWREQHCSTRECLVDWYRERQSALEAALTATPGSDADTAPQAAAAVPPAAVTKPMKTAKPPTPEAPFAVTPTPTPTPHFTRAVAAVSVAAPVMTPVIATVPAAKPAATKPPALQLQLSAAQIANIAPEGAALRAHYLSASKGEYIYADPDAKGDAQATVSVHYLGTDHGQHIIEAKRKDVYTRYTCSADCALIGKLQLPGDAETDMVILKNDHQSLPSQIVTDVLNGLLLESVVVR